MNYQDSNTRRLEFAKQNSHHRYALRAVTIVAIAIIAYVIASTPQTPQCLDQGQLINCNLLINESN